MAFELTPGCRSCGGDQFDRVLEFGEMPLSDALVKAGADRSEERLFPLTFVRCTSCSLAQILETVDPVVLYGGEYPYFSSFSDALVEHARDNVRSIVARKDLGADSLVVEVASNDGYLLQWFAKLGIPVQGIDPAAGPSNAAISRGIPTIQDFFGLGLARRLAGEGLRADVLIGNNVLAHVPDQNEFVEAIATLLAPGGSVVLEFPYVRDLVDHREFDTIYHEHHCYFSVHTARDLFRRHGLELVTVEHLSIHGGSLRVWFEDDGEPDQSVSEFLAAEETAGLNSPEYYADFGRRAQEVRSELTALLAGLKAEGARIAAYGAAAKGAILLNYCGIGPELIDFVVDRNTHKHGWEMPGVALPIEPVERLYEQRPDYLLILAWNFRDEIVSQQSRFSEAGGRFIVPIPKPVVL